MFESKYDYSDAAKIEQLIPDEFCDSMGIKSYQVRAVHNRGKRVKRRLVRSVFHDFLTLLVEELMNTNNRFISPNKEYFVFFIKEKSPQSIRRIYSNKIYTTIDPVKSGGKIYEYFIHFHLQKKTVKRPVRISRKKYLELITRVNKGQRYFK
jgi:hypothetical protein